jgi:hypothetical protein
MENVTTVNLMGEFVPIKFNELLSRQYPENVWLIERLIPETCISVIAGYPASFKTWILLDIAISIATGNKFLGEFATKQNKVLIIDEESGERILQNRFKKLTTSQDLNIEIVSYSGFNLRNSDEVIQYCLKNDIKVIIIDSLIRVHSGDENSATEMAKVFSDLQNFKKNNLSLIIAHHNRKLGKNISNPSEDMRGSSEILAFVDAAISVKKELDKKEILVTPFKLRTDEESVAFKIHIPEKDEQNFRFEYIGLYEKKEKKSKPQIAKESIAQIFTENDNKELNQKGIINLLKNKVGESAVKAAIKDMLANGLIKSRQGEGNTQYYSLVESGENIAS